MTTQTIGTRQTWLPAALRDSADWVGLAAAPTFCFMALFTGFGGGDDMMCAVAHGSEPNAMVWMYALMSGFHVTPWLRLVTPRGCGTQPC